MRTIITFAALFLSAIFVQMGSGSLGPLDALAGAVKGFSTAQIGLMGSAHFLGFFVGCMLAPRLMAQVGPSRAFAALTAVGVLSALLHPVVQNPFAWAVFRIGTGVAVAGGYTVIESWLQAKLENADRARVLGIYRFVDLTGSLLAQFMIVVLDPASYVSYNIVAMFCCLCLLPLTLTQREAPAVPVAPKLRPWRVAMLSPLAVAGVIVAGMASASFRMVGPVFADRNGLSPSEVGIFLASAVAGGALAQIPVGWIADKIDRRKALIGISMLACLVCGAISVYAVEAEPALLYLAALAFGATTFPLYSISGAHANDFAEADFIVELNASLILFFAVGAIASPYLSATLIEAYGPTALFAYVGVGHAGLILFGLYRMTTRAAVARTPYSYLPRTTMIFARLARRRRHNRRKVERRKSDRPGERRSGR